MRRAGEAVVLGAGATEIVRGTKESPLSLAARSIRAAAQDAGVELKAIDGIIVNVGSPHGVDYDVLCERLGLTVRFADQKWAHGRWAGACVQEAALAVTGGLCDVVAVVFAMRNPSQVFGGVGDVEGTREGGGPHGELPHYGLTAPGSGAAMALRRYLNKYSLPEDALGHVTTAIRHNASLNPRAVFQQPYSLAEYAKSPLVIEPLRRLDFSVTADGAVCLLISRGSGGIVIAGMQGVRSGPQEFVFARPGLGVQQQEDVPFTPSSWDLAARGMAGVSAQDVDAFYTYDAFSPLVWFALERHGFCGEGEAPEFCRDQALRVSGRLPVNTNGGLLSEGHLLGYGQLYEMVQQLRGAAEDRQVPDAEVVQWGTCFGDSLVFTKA
ncbi:thiolase family protein [Amycolatopsis jejuensis]|uniref:thiolase family protein n=1 Tax=Amycolatopsis jejuensis TaxID=330084 RepID=UPI000525D1C9|nr:thiolase family protein [Amycolatopsis jejuensis]